MATDADRLRIAVALTALKYKPAEQPVPSYVLDLRAAFPASVPSAPTSDGSWRNHALDLEREVTALKAKLDSEQIKSAGLSKEVNTLKAKALANEESISTQPEAQSKKKRKKAVPVVAPTPSPLDPVRLPDFSLKSIFEDISDKPEFIDIDSKHSVTSSFTALDRLVSVTPPEILFKSPSLLIATCMKALDSLIAVLQPFFSDVSKTNSSGVSGDLLKTVNLLLLYLLENLLSPFNQPKKKTNATNFAHTQASEDIDTFNGRLCRELLAPLICLIASFSERYAEALLVPSRKAKPRGFVTPGTSCTLDLRPALFRILQTVISQVDQLYCSVSAFLTHDTVHLRESLALSCVRELTKILRAIEQNFWPTSARDNSSCQRPISETRASMLRLVYKDTIWYLCSIVNCIFTTRRDNVRLSKVESPSGTTLLRSGILDGLKEALALCRTKQTLSPFDDIKDNEGLDYSPGPSGISMAMSNCQPELPTAETSLFVSGSDKAANDNGADPRDVKVDCAGINDGKQEDAEMRYQELVRNLERRHLSLTNDEVTYEIILGVVERFWLWDSSS